VILVASTNGDVGMDAAWEILAAGGSALDAVEAGTRLVEDNADDHTVGYSGYPNLLGQVELDASIMDGTTRRAGAVGALRRNRAAITVARAVMERLPHVLVVGSGADSLAEEVGLPEEDLLTEEAADLWRRGREGNLPPDSVAGRMLSAVARLATDPERAAGTVNFIAVDRDGRIASAVSTSGWAWKHPGRLGDSPVIGAGNYADDRYGAAACTGFGELAIRASTARTVVAGMAAGRPVSAAAVEAMHDLATLGMPPEQAIMSLVAVGADGSHVAVSTREGATYVVREEGMRSFEQRDRLLVDLSA
jgi:L-asparaginase / beta-aspartyl-peptidase